MSYKVNIHIYLELQNNQFFSWSFQLDDSKSLHIKMVVHQTSFKNWLFRGYQVLAYSCFPVQAYEAREKFQQQVLQAMEDSKERAFFLVLLPTVHWSLYLAKNNFHPIMFVRDSEFLYVFYTIYHILLVFPGVCHLGWTPQGLKRYPIIRMKWNEGIKSHFEIFI